MYPVKTSHIMLLSAQNPPMRVNAKVFPRVHRALPDLAPLCLWPCPPGLCPSFTLLPDHTAFLCFHEYSRHLFKSEGLGNCCSGSLGLSSSHLCMAGCLVSFRGHMPPSPRRLPWLPVSPPQLSLCLFSLCFPLKHIELASYWLPLIYSLCWLCHMM